MAYDCVKVTLIIVLCLTVIFAIVEIGLASDLTWHINRSFFGFASWIRPRTRYLVFCSVWTLFSGIILVALLALASAITAIVVSLIILLMSMIFWLIAASLFTSLLGGSGINCGPGLPDCHVVNVINTTMAFAWINWSFIMIAFLLALWLACFGRDRDRERERKEPPNQPNQMGTANTGPSAPVTNVPPANPPA